MATLPTGLVRRITDDIIHCVAGWWMMWPLPSRSGLMQPPEPYSSGGIDYIPDSGGIQYILQLCIVVNRVIITKIQERTMHLL
jgi:hypothetical protein